jgi:hypothetical protein
VARSATMITRKRLIRGLKVAAGGVLLLLVAYALWVRPWHQRWGATDAELAAAMPGDTLVEARYASTRAITIRAGVTDVWPWLVQMGQDRGGLYSYDWLENLMGLRIHSAAHVDPRWQHLATGDRVWLAPPDYPTPFVLEVADLEPEHHLVLRTPLTREAAYATGRTYSSWAFVLEPQGPRTTRLVVRWRSDFRPTVAERLVNQYLVEAAHFVMERRMLLGIKARAEALRRARVELAPR